MNTKPKTKKIMALSLDKDLVNKLHEQSDLTEVAMSRIVNRILREYFDNLS